MQTSGFIRGIPQEKCDIHHNWFNKHSSAAQAVKASVKTEIKNNAYGNEPYIDK